MPEYDVILQELALLHQKDLINQQDSWKSLKMNNKLAQKVSFMTIKNLVFADVAAIQCLGIRIKLSLYIMRIKLKACETKSNMKDRQTIFDAFLENIVR